MQTARVIEEQRTNYIISDDGVELLATVRGYFFDEGQFPKVGDEVSYSIVADGKAVIEEVLPRRSSIVRKSVDGAGEQVIVANVDVVFIVMGLDDDFNMSRLERYLLLARQSDVQPVVVLNKADVVEGEADVLAEFMRQAEAVAGAVPVHTVSALTGAGLDALRSYFTPDTTAVLLGSSGAGKSTITNWLLRADVQAVQEVREDDSHGRHTTTARQLFTLPTGGYLIDTPGMRELGVYSTEESEADTFSKLDELSFQCRFPNCDHEKSDGCAIVAAIDAGEVESRQLQNYLKLQRERAHEASKHDETLSYEQRQKQKRLHQQYKRVKQGKGIGRWYR
jgi:ribosome biogenesis GTPase